MAGWCYPQGLYTQQSRLNDTTVELPQDGVPVAGTAPSTAAHIARQGRATPGAASSLHSSNNLRGGNSGMPVASAGLATAHLRVLDYSMQDASLAGCQAPQEALHLQCSSATEHVC